ncbi:hypothetical protein ACFQ1S_18300 [Kibdelosporangium lantanae]|uniref:Uncharacterized protein n=1 Tax=Kibdelosporangium lantanae TaxID=1497396 RepID=A0ABW3MCN1_9PSEU
MTTVSARAEESAQLRDVTLRLRTNAEQVWHEFHEVDRRHAMVFDDLHRQIIAMDGSNRPG